LVFPYKTSLDALITLRDAIYDERARKESQNVQASSCSLLLSSTSQQGAQASQTKTEGTASITTTGMVRKSYCLYSVAFAHFAIMLSLCSYL
jgi:hypothetical protein